MISTNYSINGAGVLLIEKYRNRFGRQEFAVILFKDRRRNNYADAGGKIEIGENILQTAGEELKEESANLFRIHPRFLDKFVVSKSYACFPLVVTGPMQDYGSIFSKYYKHNLALLHYTYSPDEFKETINMKRFYLVDLINCGIMHTDNEFSYNSDIICGDAHGEYQSISGRTIGVIRELIKNGTIQFSANMTTINLPLIMLDINPDFMSQNHPFLNHTITYYAK